MTALPEEVEGAVAEGAELLTLQAPVRIEADEDGNADRPVDPAADAGPDGRAGPAADPNAASLPERRIPADIIIVAIGQGIETRRL